MEGGETKMKKEEYWKEFMVSGSVNDYLKYKQVMSDYKKSDSDGSDGENTERDSHGMQVKYHAGFY